MSRPREPSSWEADADQVADDLRDQLQSAKSRMSEHRDQMRAAGLCGRRPEQTEQPEP
jgi:hypothetical protein